MEELSVKGKPGVGSDIWENVAIRSENAPEAWENAFFS
jgi:hypothetical protein